MVVSAIRSAYETDTHFFHDSAQTARVLWYFVPEDAPNLPYPSQFCDTVWNERNYDVQQRVGELQTGHVYSKGFPPAAYPVPGKLPCGSAEQWLNGASVNDPVPGVYPGTTVPLCCPDRIEIFNEGGQSEGKLIPDPASPCDASCVRPDTVYAQITNLDNFGCAALGTIVPLNFKNGDWELDPSHFKYLWESPVFPWGTATATLAVFCQVGTLDVWWCLKDPLNVNNSSTLFKIAFWTCSPVHGISVGSDAQPPGCAWIIEWTFFQ